MEYWIAIALFGLLALGVVAARDRLLRPWVALVVLVVAAVIGIVEALIRLDAISVSTASEVQLIAIILIAGFALTMPRRLDRQ